MSNEMIDSLAGAKESGTRLPFLSPGTVGCQYGLKFLGVSQWNAKPKNNKQEKGDWRCQFKFEVIHAEGDGATPVRTITQALILEDTQFGTYHLQDFRKYASAIFVSAGLSWIESDKPEDQAKMKQQIQDLYAGKFNGVTVAAQVSPNPEAKRAKFPITSYFGVPPETANKTE